MNPRTPRKELRGERNSRIDLNEAKKKDNVEKHIQNESPRHGKRISDLLYGSRTTRIIDD